MPEIKLQHVISVSSEDKDFTAESLLKPEGVKKWKSAATGEKQISVTLQFEKSSKIHQIDIGNEGSAFVEVLVGKSSQTSEQDYQVILVASSFMSPIESKNNQNLNRVRIFSSDKLSKAVSDKTWDRIKVVCTQPFNKHIAYGLSFIKLHSPPGDGDSSEKAAPKLGAFKLKTDTDEDSITTGSIFAHRKEKKSPEPLTGAAAARAASKLAESAAAAASPAASKAVSKTASSVVSKTASPAVSKTASPAVSKTNENNTTPGKRKHDDGERPSTAKHTNKKDAPKSSSSSARKDEKPPPKKRTKSDSAKNSKPVELDKLLKGVTFVLSGFQNPQRGQLRDKALAMGAVYKPDWDKGCTHLICAFANTPKYNQVLGKGKIVTKHWITDCYKEKKLLNWKKYRMDDEDDDDEDDWSASDESEEEDWEPRSKKAKSPPRSKKSPPKTKQKSPAKKTDSQDSKKPESPKPSKPSPAKKAKQLKEESGDETDPYAGSTDVDSDADTEDELRKVKEENNKANTPKKKSESPKKAATSEDPYEGSTDVDSDNEPSPGLPELPDFFSDKHFFLYGDFSSAERRTLYRYITAFDGEVEDYMNEKVTFVITAKEWDDDFDDALADNSKLLFVKPQWIHACQEKNKLLPHQKYCVVPK